MVILMKNALNTPIKISKDSLQSKPIKTKKLYIENGDHAILSLYKENGKAYAVLNFDENNTGSHIKLAAKYFSGKPLEIDMQHLEKILEQL